MIPGWTPPARGSAPGPAKVQRQEPSVFMTLTKAGLKAMVRLSNRLCYPTGCDWRVVEETSKSHCNAVFKTKGPSAVVLVATKDIVLGQWSQEIFVSYSIQSYWVPCIASKVLKWGVGNEMVQAVMWCAASERSNWPPTL